MRIMLYIKMTDIISYNYVFIYLILFYIINFTYKSLCSCVREYVKIHNCWL